MLHKTTPIIKLYMIVKGASSGVNIIDLSFGDYSPGLGGLEAPEEIIRSN